MGMFDMVLFEADCPICGYRLKDFQTKDGENILDYIEPSAVNHFYEYCPKCECWLDYRKLKNGNFLRRVKVNDEWDNNFTEELRI